jgi:hypothetical protein
MSGLSISVIELMDAIFDLSFECQSLSSVVANCLPAANQVADRSFDFGIATGQGKLAQEVGVDIEIDPAALGMPIKPSVCQVGIQNAAEYVERETCLSQRQDQIDREANESGPLGESELRPFAHLDA